MFSAPGSDDHLFLSTQPAGAKERRAALAIVIVSAAIFVMIAPFAKVPLPPLPTFVAVYQSALVVNDLITAAFLFTQFGIVRSRSILLLASAYLFTALMATAHALTFPGLFSPTGLLGAGPQSTAWLYMFWHVGFPFLVLAYTWTHRRERPDESRNMCDRNAVLLCLAATTVAAGGLVLLATHGQTLLPAIMQSHNYTSAMTVVIASVWALSVAALFAVWRRRPHSVLDLWLLVVLCAWTFDIALSAMLNAGR
ncbi:MAG TPA: MASE4 domain-containing protein, partial [Hyphomicrobiaceae bacterium]|nr:MASE4 domain-containing protein [Hyphomicrobiaceae bacterium]